MLAHRLLSFCGTFVVFLITLALSKGSTALTTLNLFGGSSWLLEASIRLLISVWYLLSHPDLDLEASSYHWSSLRPNTCRFFLITSLHRSLGPLCGWVCMQEPAKKAYFWSAILGHSNDVAKPLHPTPHHLYSSIFSVTPFLPQIQ